MEGRGSLSSANFSLVKVVLRQPASAPFGTTPTRRARGTCYKCRLEGLAGLLASLVLAAFTLSAVLISMPQYQRAGAQDSCR